MELDVLAGDWDVRAVVDGNTVSTARYSYEWIEEGAFMVHRAQVQLPADAPQVWKDNAPTSMVAVIGRDDRSGRYAYLYTDSRGVHRVYEMSLEGRDWRIWGRAGETFFQ